jgi:hypothetical protein
MAIKPKIHVAGIYDIIDVLLLLYFYGNYYAGFGIFFAYLPITGSIYI